MTLYSVYERPDAAPVAIADRFSAFAALLPPIYALTHGLWLLLVGWIALVIAIGVIGAIAGGEAAFWIYLAAALLIGLEAPTLRRLKLGRTGWRYGSEIFAAGEDEAAVAWLQRQ